MKTTLQKSVSPSPQNQILTGSRTSSPGDQFLHKGRRFRFSRTSCPNQVASVDENVFGTRDSAHNFLQRLNLAAREHRRQDRLFGARCLFQDAQFFRSRGISHHHIEHEAIELRFRQRIGAFLFNGILRCQSKKRIRQIVCVRPDSDMSFLHGFQQSSLGLWRRTIDFVGQQNVGEQRPLDKLEDSPASFRIILQHVGARNVRRHQVGRKLNAAKGQLQNTGDGAAEQCLRQSGNADKQAMPATKHGNQQLINNFILADDHFADFLTHALIGICQATNCLFFKRSRCNFGAIVGTLWFGVRHSRTDGLIRIVNVADSE